jgi:hypothetical protein
MNKEEITKIYPRYSDTTTTICTISLNELYIEILEQSDLIKRSNKNEKI